MAKENYLRDVIAHTSIFMYERGEELMSYPHAAMLHVSNAERYESLRYGFESVVEKISENFPEIKPRLEELDNTEKYPDENLDRKIKTINNFLFGAGYFLDSVKDGKNFPNNLNSLSEILNLGYYYMRNNFTKLSEKNHEKNIVLGFLFLEGRIRTLSEGFNERLKAIKNSNLSPEESFTARIHWINSLVVSMRNIQIANRFID